MKRQNWLLGLIISLGISLLAVLPRMIRLEDFNVWYIITVVLYNFLFCFSCWIIYQYLFTKTRFFTKGKQSIVYTLLVMLLTALLSHVYDFAFCLANLTRLQLTDISETRRPIALLLRGLVISGLFYFIWYYLHVLSEKQKINLEIEQLKQAQLAAHLSSLKEQLSPHFLFNTLNTLSTLTQETEVESYVAELANVYRYMLQYKMLDIATIKQEIEFIESYLYIIKTRMEDAIEINIHVDESLLPSSIPPLTLQLLVENAIKHNVASASKQLKIEIQNTPDNYLMIKNNIQPRSSVTHSTDTGLYNIMQRYHLLFDKEIIIEKNSQYFIIKLPVV